MGTGTEVAKQPTANYITAAICKREPTSITNRQYRRCKVTAWSARPGRPASRS
jgi:hypothetical protein